MKTLKVQEALKELKKGLSWKKVFIYGEESYLTDQFLKKLSEIREIEKFYPDSLEELFGFTGSSLFGPSPLPVIVHGEELPKFLKKKSEREKFLRKLKSLEEFVVAAFSGLDYRTLKGELFSEIFRMVEVSVVSEPYPTKAKLSLIKKKLSQRKDVKPEVINLIAEKVEGDLWELKNETDKLLCYPGELSEEVVELLISSTPKVDLFNLIYLLIEGRKKEFLSQVSHLLSEGAEPLQLIGLLQSQVRQLIKTASGQPPKLPQQALRKLQLYGRKLGVKRGLKLLKLLNEAEFSVKTGRATGDEALTGLAFKDFD